MVPFNTLKKMKVVFPGAENSQRWPSASVGELRGNDLLKFEEII